MFGKLPLPGHRHVCFDAGPGLWELLLHISEGILSAPVLIGGGVLAAVGVAVGLARLEDRKITICALLSAVFFVGSLIHVPIGFANAHLILCGLLGVILGWSSFPAIFIALLLQAILFQYGGFTTLGVNTFTMGASAVLSWYVYRVFSTLFPSRISGIISGFCAGFLGVAFAAILAALALAFTSEGFTGAAYALIMAHFPVMIVEGIITSLTVAFLKKIRPQLLYTGQPQAFNSCLKH